MNRFFLNSDQIIDDKVVFPADLAHQIKHVLRLAEGDFVDILDNRGHIYRVKLKMRPDDRSLTGKIVDKQTADSETAVQVSLCFGLTNRDKVEWILQKGTEIGVSAFYPFVSSRTLVQKLTLPSKKVARWERIIREAAEQAERSRLPILHTPMDYTDCVSQVTKSHGVCLVAWEQVKSVEKTLHDRMASFEQDSIGLFVGPEGGFSEQEVTLARESGCQIVSLGKRILRLETAAIVFPALVLHELGEL